MDIQYFKSAWGDIKNSPGWFGKLCLLTLLNFIPIFGQIVTFGYLYGWAREIAWGAHEPMPRKLFANEDGKFWRRGWFVLVLTFVFALVPSIVMNIGDSLQGLGFATTFFEERYVATPGWLVVGSLVSLIGSIGLLLTAILAWIGNMRVAIYDRLSAGFQLGKVWKMLRRDTGGIARIFGMELLFGLIFGFVLSVIFAVLIAMVVAAGVSGLISAGYSLEALQYMSSTQALRMLAQFFASAGIVGVFAVLIGGFLAAMVSVFVEMLVVRALGYWTMQFEVPLWGGQDDPMPFELAQEEPSPYYAGPNAGTPGTPGPQGAAEAPRTSGAAAGSWDRGTGSQAAGAQSEWTPSSQLQGWQPGAASGAGAGFGQVPQAAPGSAGATGATGATGAPGASGAPVEVPGHVAAGEVVAPIAAAAAVDSAASEKFAAATSGAAGVREAGSNGVEYGGAAVVGAGFLMTPAEIDAAEAEVRAEAWAQDGESAAAAEGAGADLGEGGGADRAEDRAEDGGADQDGGIGEYHVRYDGPAFGSDASADDDARIG